MAHENVIVIQPGGKKIAEAYLKKVVAKYTTYMGAALIYDNKMVVSKAKGAPTLEAIADIQSAFPDNTIVFTFGQGDKDIFDEDMQPFEVLKNDAGETIVIACLEGGFQGYSVVKSTHTDEFHCVQDFITPKLKKLAKSAGGDLKGLIEELSDPITQKDFANSWTDRGNITLLTVEGPPITFSSGNDAKAQYTNFWTSNSLGHMEQVGATEEKKVAAPVVPDKPLTLLQKLKLKAGKAPTVDPPLEDRPDFLYEAVAPGKTDTAIDAGKPKASEVSGEWIKPPTDVNTNQKLSDWYMAKVGYKPQKYKTRPQVWLTSERKAELTAGTAKPIPSSDLKAMVTAHPAAGDAASPLPPSEQLAASQQDKTTDQPAAMSGEALPMLSPRVKKSIADGWMKTPEVLKILGEDHSVVFDPKRMVEFENKFATFADHFGLGSLDTTANWPYSMFLSLGKDHVEALAVLAFNLRNEMLKAKLANPNVKLMLPSNRQKVAM